MSVFVDTAVLYCDTEDCDNSIELKNINAKVEEEKMNVLSYDWFFEIGNSAFEAGWINELGGDIETRCPACEARTTEED